jgi:hypothetical protein
VSGKSFRARMMSDRRCSQAPSEAAIVTCVLADGDAGATVIIRCALTMRLRSRDFAVPMDAKGCEVMAVCSASVDDGARNPFAPQRHAGINFVLQRR